MPFWHDLVTEKSFELLKELRKNYRFILIGGWAVYLYARTLKSKDIDLIIEPEELGRFREKFEVVKNPRLKKYEARAGEIDIDLYLPYFSNPGIPAEEIGGTTILREGFRIPAIETLFLLKMNAYQARKGSLKGEKDELDLISLMMTEEIDWKKWKTLLGKHQRNDLDPLLKNLLSKKREVPELGLSAHRWAQLKRKILKF